MADFSFYQQRISNLQNLLTGELLVIENPIDIYYLTGLNISTGTLIIFEQHAELFVDMRYYELCKKQVPIPVRAVKGNALENFINSPQGSKVHTVAFDMSNTSYRRYLDIQAILQEINRNITLLPSDAPLKQLRAKKDSYEITKLQNAADLGSQGFDYLLSVLTEGITEQETAVQLELFWKSKGGKAPSFDPIIAFGANSAMPHYRAGNRALKKGDLVLLDIGVEMDHYHSDMTRVLFFGDVDERLQTIYRIVEEAQLAALRLIKPGIKVSQLDAAARTVIADKGFGDFFTHSLGHGVGLEIHEAPWIRSTEDTVIQPNMIFTIEPGIYLPDLGGVRLEDTIRVTEDGYVSLTKRPLNPYLLNI